MKVGIMQPYFFPYIGYWQLMNAVDKYVIYDDVNYIKGGWINRNRILIDGQPKMLNIKLNGASSNKFINEVMVSRDSVFKKKLLKTISHSYKKAPLYEKVYPLIEKIILYEEEQLALYLQNTIEMIADYLEMNTQFILSSNIEKNNLLTGQEKVIEICKILEANEYYNAIGGKELYSKELFNENNISLKFLHTDLIEYNQFDNEFEPNLSVIDIMMFNSKDEINSMMNSYSLI